MKLIKIIIINISRIRFIFSNSISFTRTNRHLACVRLEFSGLFRENDQQHGGKHASTYSGNIHERVQRQWKSVNAAVLNE